MQIAMEPELAGAGVQVQWEAERKVFTEHFTELVTSVQNSVLSIANECLSEKLITTSVQKRTLDESDTEKAGTMLLNAVKDCMEHQKDGFKKFLKILEKQHIFDDLVDGLKESVERKHTTECTDAEVVPACDSAGILIKTSIKTSIAESRRAIRKRVIKSHLAVIKSCVQGLIASVSSSSHTKQLISKTTYQRIMRPNQLSKQRTNFLLHSVCKCVRGDSKKFNVFLEILDTHRSCKVIVRTIREEISCSISTSVSGDCSTRTHQFTTKKSRTYTTT